MPSRPLVDGIAAGYGVCFWGFRRRRRRWIHHNEKDLETHVERRARDNQPRNKNKQPASWVRRMIGPANARG
eukprot:scaffold29016_cov43-Cyclotella_meneghiniana.AAC.1